jgi:broad specificity phosphatase PhoE
MPSEIYLIRHGQANFGSRDYDRLSSIGVRQSVVLADHLLDHGIDFDAIYCGRLKRQIATALPLCERMGRNLPAGAAPVVIEAFNEYSSEAIVAARLRRERQRWPAEGAAPPGPPQDQKAFQAFFSETVNGWLAGEFDAEPGVEPWPVFCRRVSGGVRDIIAHHGRGKRLAVFTSGGPIMAVVKESLGLSGAKAVELGWQIMNASVTCIRYRQERLTLSVFNSTSHLLIEKDPSLLTYR